MLSAAALLSPDGAALDIARFRPYPVGPQPAPTYQVRVVDLNGDGLLDILPTVPVFESTPLNWYENPDWTAHPIATGIVPVGLWTAAQDLDGDRIPELILAGGFSPLGIEKSSGELYLLDSRGAPEQRWQMRLIDQLPMSHRIEFVDINGQGDPLLVVAPIVGGPAESLEVYPGVTPLVYYTPGTWKRASIKSDIKGFVHGMIAVDYDGIPGDEVLTAGLQGVWLHKPARRGAGVQWSSERLVSGFSGAGEFERGASDMRVGRLADGSRFLLTVEPFHGGNVVVYLQTGARWARQQIDGGLVSIHALAVGDLNGDGGDEIIIGNRSKPYGTYIYYAVDATGSQWRRELLDDTMGGAACNVADINGDDRLDIACGGQFSENLRWYENLGNTRDLP